MPLSTKQLELWSSPKCSSPSPLKHLIPQYLIAPGKPCWYLDTCIKQNNSEVSFLGKELMTLKLPNSSLNQEFQRNLKLAIEILISAQSPPPPPPPLIVGRWTFLYISSLCFTQGSCKNQNQLFVNLMILSPSIAHHLFNKLFISLFLCFSANMKMFKQNGRIPLSSV